LLIDFQRNIIMTRLNFVTNDKGEKVALLIPIDNKKLNGDKLLEYIEDLEDLIYLEFSKKEATTPLDKVVKNLQKRKK